MHITDNISLTHLFPHSLSVDQSEIQVWFTMGAPLVASLSSTAGAACVEWVDPGSWLVLSHVHQGAHAHSVNPTWAPGATPSERAIDQKRHAIHHSSGSDQPSVPDV